MTLSPEHLHSHNHGREAALMSARRLVLALILTLAFVGVEAAAGVVANSLALLTDAAHNLTDVLTLGLSWYAIRLALRPSSSSHTYGYHRAGILIALFNSTTLVVIALGIFWEAYQRLIHPLAVEANILIAVAAIAFVVNGGTALLVRRGSETNLNMRGAYVHLAADAVSTLAAIITGVVIKLTGWQVLDPVVSIFIGALILWNGWGIIRQSVDILLERTPRGLDMSALVKDMMAVEGVRGVHDLHVWSVAENMTALSAHLLTEDVSISKGAEVQRAVNAVLHHYYQIAHATLQLECEGCQPDVLYCDLSVPHVHDTETEIRVG